MADAEKTDGEEKKPSLMKKLMLPVVMSLVVAGIAIGALHYFGVIKLGGEPEMAATAEGEEGAEGDMEPEGSKAGMPAFFFSFYPDMLVTMSSGSSTHYLKLKIDVMARDEELVAAVEQFHPIMRNNLIKLFQEVTYELASSPEGLETLQAMAAEEVKRVLKKYHGPSDIEGVYFTSFVVQ
ncbi:MAG: flagellar basal body-associated protein FliL [Gammaproteobacteria bacterium]